MLKLLKQYYFTVTFLIIIISKIHEFYIYLFQINHLVIFLAIAPTNFIPSKIFNSEFQNIEVWFTYQNIQPLETEKRINLTLVIK